MRDTPGVPAAEIGRRDFLTGGVLGAVGALASAGLMVGSGRLSAQEVQRGRAAQEARRDRETAAAAAEAEGMGGIPPRNSDLVPGFAGEVDHAANGFDPTEILTDFDHGKVSTLPSGQKLHEYDIVSVDQEIEVVPGMSFPAWSYNGRVPGPTLRVGEGDRVRIHFKNLSPHAHGMHFHGIHSHAMDGVPGAGPGLIEPGKSFTYEFDAEPFGVHLYHCHTFPLAKHVAKGLYGAFIVDPKGGWPKADHEFLMVMNGFDMDFDGANEFYAVNSIPFHYMNHPIPIGVGDLVRVFLVNALEYDPSNSFHLHANFFHYYPTGTQLTPSEFTDTIAQMQAQRGILEFRFKFPGRFMFHAHKSEFAELGWTGQFQVNGTAADD